MKLVIFDLDQTLVELTDVHARLTHDELRRFFGIDAELAEVDYAGRTLTDSWHRLARLHGVPEQTFHEKIGEFLKAYDADFPSVLPPDPATYVLPGARELLDALARTDSMLVLYTGDSPGVARAVLGATGLDRYFAFRFFGTEVAERADMVRNAIKAAEQRTGRTFSGKDIVIVGDSIRDVGCGRVFSARTIAVATGFYSKQDLAAAGPDHLVDSLRDYQAVLKLILS